ncbi:tellurium resistance protein [Xanthomonas vasicola]|uniref:Toxic anion resistance protein n=1 Tax=Xanthomonas hortorum pv. vitians TaxID=83224 RepID=A0AAW8ZT31_9XANT|nr:MULTISPECIES: toxic anion resistance protein [Xanthomonas]CAD7741763.1 TelA-like protein [Xanthomonas hydrangeae]KGR62620.1 tellurium resistance protein [Xanthomonas vasicola]MDV7248909.1 toxic anion resistance protein [Xanthomonas hortorum pv. vitians]CAD7741767.1 TelA-like protein [Xanthomonas hydrangeae]CAD7748074.1 TelA-like protein [Xanthomonas hydrangeae]
MNAMQQSKTVLVASFQMTPDSLRELGLREADVPEIQQVAQRIEVGSPQAVAEFGRDVADHTSRYADSLLDQVRNSDLDEAGEKLTQVVAKARSLNIGALSDNRSRVPVIGPLIDRFRVRSTAFMARFDTTREQIERLVGDVQATQQSITQRNASLDDMFVAVREEHRLLGVHIAAGKLRLAELGAQAESLRGSLENDPGRVQELADLDAMLANLDKRIGDLIALQHSAMQSLPTIRMIQANNQMLVDKFHTIREITVPAWKRQFMLALSLNEQKNAVELATAIDDTTNDLMKRNAALLHRTSVETAKENQRLVIDVDTLKQVQTTLIKTVEDVLRIQQEGVQKRKDAEKQIAAMRGDLQAKLTRQPARVLPQQEGA